MLSLDGTFCPPPPFKQRHTHRADSTTSYNLYNVHHSVYMFVYMPCRRCNPTSYQSLQWHQSSTQPQTWRLAQTSAVFTEERAKQLVAGAQVLWLVVLPSRPDGYNPLLIRNLTIEAVEKLACASKLAWDAICTMDKARLGKALLSTMDAWAEMLPETVGRAPSLLELHSTPLSCLSSP